MVSLKLPYIKLRILIQANSMRMHPVDHVSYRI